MTNFINYKGQNQQLASPALMYVYDSDSDTYIPATSSIFAGGGAAPKGLYTDFSSSTTGSGSFFAASGNSSRKSLIFQNRSDYNMAINFEGSADVQNDGSILITPEGSFVLSNDAFVNTGSIYIGGIASGQRYTLKEG